MKADILIVEDDIVTAKVISGYLKKNNYNVLKIIPDGETAVSAALELKPDLILMDIFLKDSIDGIEASQRIREKIDIPVIFLTGDSTDETIQRAKITEPFGYLLKPVNNSVLITNIELTLQKQFSYNKKILQTLKEANDQLEKRVTERTLELRQANENLLHEMEQRRLAEEELRKADKLATIGKMSAVLAHEIRNPLNSIKINADILIERLKLEENQKKRLVIIQKEVDRLNNLVKDVLQFSRQSSILNIEFNLPIFFEGVAEQVKSVLENKNIELSMKIPEITLTGDVEKIRQVFLNLILNSVDAIYENGKINIYTDNEEKGKIKVFVKDSGAGLTNPEKLFEPFFTTKGTGTGLGLSISQNIIEQHNGSLYLVSSKPGETIFAVELNTNNI